MPISLQNLSKIRSLETAWGLVKSRKSIESRKNSRGIDKVSLEDFEKNLSENLNLISNKLRNNSYEPDSVKIVPQKKENGKYRFIAVPTIRDRIVQRAMLELFMPYIKNIIQTGVSYCGVKNDENEAMCTKKAVKKIIDHIKNGLFWFFKSDIEGFFDNIPKKSILKKIQNKIPLSEEVFKLTKKYIHYQVGNPEVFQKHRLKIPDDILGITQGSALSPVFANLYLADFDRKVKKVFGDRFIRYVDDFVVICKDQKEAKEALNFLKDEIKKIDLSLPNENKKDSKTRTGNLRASNKIDFLGLAIDRNRICPKGGIKELRFKIQNKLKLKKKNGEEYKSVKRNGKEYSVREQIEEKIMGWAKHYSFYHVKELYESLDIFIRERAKNTKLLKGMIGLGTIKLSPIISEGDWQKMFSTKH
ncbi:hypothetical protein HZA38_06265 [Candidatus Peregrinibacteria bacterium]|nr:hypothetical protein [Candidatus Peregrinibacteria bacterium]